MDEPETKQEPRREMQLKAASGALHMTYRGTLVQHRAWFHLLANAFHELADDSVKHHEIPWKKLLDLVGWKKGSVGALKKDIESLQRVTVQWNVLGKDPSSDWDASYSLLADAADDRRGNLVYTFGNLFRRHLADPRFYSWICLELIGLFRSKYSLALYLLCLDYKGVGKTPRMAVSKYREFMGVDTDEYLEFKRLSRRVIHDPIEEINNVSDIEVECQMSKVGRTVTHVQFTVRTKENHPLTKALQLPPRPLEGEYQLLSSDGGPVQEARAPAIGPAPEDSLFVRLTNEFRLTTDEALEIIDKHTEDHIRAAFERIRARMSDTTQPRVRDVRVYTLASISGKPDSQGQPQRRPNPSRQAHPAVKGEQAKGKTTTGIEKLYGGYQATVARGYLAGLSPNERTGLQEEFFSNAGSVTFAARARTLDHPAVFSEFVVYLEKVGRLPVTERGFLAYIAQQGFVDPSTEASAKAFFSQNRPVA